MAFIHQAWDSTRIGAQRIWDQTRVAGRNSVDWVKQTKDRTIQAAQDIWHHKIQQQFWQNTIKTKLINNKIKPLAQSAKNYFYKDNEEYWDWKNIAIMTGGIAIPVLLVLGGLALTPLPYFALFGLGGFLIFLGACGWSQHRLQKAFDEKIWDHLDLLALEINGKTQKQADFTTIERECEQLDFEKNFKMHHRKDELKDLKKEIEALKTLCRSDKSDQLDLDQQITQCRNTLLTKIAFIQGKLSKRAATSYMAPPPVAPPLPTKRKKTKGKGKENNFRVDVEEE
jgi:hypothetical protein